MTRRAALGVLLLLIGAGADAAERSFAVPIAHGRVPPELRVLRVRQGDVVTLRWTSDRPLTLHLHGYDIEWRVAPGAGAQSTFTAVATGRFPVETHAPPGHGETLLYLEVTPH
jgi:FtsP/CotA-like multicopper oxidase with cupredoxin domain